MISVLVTDAQINSIAIVLVALISIIPTTLAALWAREARRTTHSVKKDVSEVRREVMTNGGMSDPNPNLNDHVKYQTEMMENLVNTVVDVDTRLTDHIDHSKVMDSALAEVYLTVKKQKLDDTPLPDEDSD